MLCHACTLCQGHPFPETRRGFWCLVCIMDFVVNLFFDFGGPSLWENTGNIHEKIAKFQILRSWWFPNGGPALSGNQTPFPLFNLNLTPFSPSILPHCNFGFAFLPQFNVCFAGNLEPRLRNHGPGLQKNGKQ